MIHPAARILFVGAALAAAILFIVLGFVSLRRGPRTKYLRYWVSVCFLGGLFLTAMVLAGEVESRALAELIVRLGMSLACLTMLAFLLFSVAFAGQVRGGAVIEAVAVIWCGANLLLFWFTDLVIAGVTVSEFSRYSPVPGRMIPLYLGYVTLAWLFSLVLFIRTFRRSRGLRRTQAAYTIAAFVVGLVAASGTILPSITRSQSLVAALPALLFPLFPLIITYAIIRHRLWDIRTIMHRTAVWLILSLGLLVPMFIVLRLGAPLFEQLGAADLAALLVLLFLVGHQYLRIVQPRLNHWFQRRALDRQAALDKFTRDVVSLGRLDDVTQRLLDTLDESLYPQHAEIRVVQAGDRSWRSVRRPEPMAEPTPAPNDPKDRFLRLMSRIGGAVERGQIEVDQRFDAVRELANQHYDEVVALVCLPLVQKERLIGVLWLGEKRNLRPYSLEDLEFLDRLGAEASIGIANALLFDRVDRQREVLQGLTDTLEQRVTARTEELSVVNRQLSDANEELQALDQLKSRLFTNISHELRSPLTLILAPLDLLLSGRFGDVASEQQESLDRIRHSALEMLKRTDDLLDLARLQESRLELSSHPCVLADLVEQILDVASPLADRRRIALSCVCEVRPTVICDAEKIERVVVNLLTNALKFTSAGGEIRLRLHQPDLLTVSIAVEDTGVGIEPAQLEHIFDRFHQVSGSNRKGGIGIGLAIAKEIATLHGGELSARSEPGRGTTFVLTLPVQGLSRAAGAEPTAAASADAPLEPSHVPRVAADSDIQLKPEYRFLGLEDVPEPETLGSAGALTTRRVLLVEDNPEMLRLLQQILNPHYETSLAERGEAAWQLLLQERPELVISDVSMPGMSGIELCQRIKGDARTQEVPVLLLTARSALDQRVEGHDAGADGYLTKPFEPAELTAIVDGLLQGRSRAREVASRRRGASMESLLAGLAHELGNASHQLRTTFSAVQAVTRRAAAQYAESNAEPTNAESADAAEAGSPSGGANDPLSRLTRLEGVSERALHRISQVVKSLRLYARRHLKAPWGELVFDQLVRKQVELVSQVADSDDHRVAVNLHLKSEATIHGPQEELGQLVNNLVENALQAVISKGTVQVITAAANGTVTLTVRDDGCGMTTETQEQAFDPFFTTRDPGAGMGLGLALCERTVSDMGGKISLHSKPGLGTEVVVELPVSGNPDDPPEGAPAEEGHRESFPAGQL